jgi:hypothetical protein
MIELLQLKTTLEATRDGAADVYPDHPEIAAEIALRATKTIEAIDARLALTAPAPIIVEEPIDEP